MSRREVRGYGQLEPLTLTECFPSLFRDVPQSLLPPLMFNKFSYSFSLLLPLAAFISSCLLYFSLISAHPTQMFWYQMRGLCAGHISKRSGAESAKQSLSPQLLHVHDV